MSFQPKMFRDPNGNLMVERFSPIRRYEHWLGMVVFVVLVLTGFPQKFHGDGSAWLLGVFGGLENARLAHRVAGVVFGVHAGVHLTAAIVGIMTRRMRPALLPTPQDLRDAWQNLGYFLGYRDRPPALPKFDYRQKFEYVGMVLGGCVMILSGLALMYPIQIAAALGGQLIPAARVAHSYEALLALSVLVIWHVYGAGLSPEVYPLDKSIFTGYIAAHELEERHGLEFQRVFPDGLPEPERTQPEVEPIAATPRAAEWAGDEVEVKDG
jgi:cytochrome b subunit of formate dehydrogenase